MFNEEIKLREEDFGRAQTIYLFYFDDLSYRNASLTVDVHSRGQRNNSLKVILNEK